MDNGKDYQNEIELTNRQKAGEWIESVYVQNLIVALIIINAIIIGLETTDGIYFINSKFIKLIDDCILFIFSLEVLVKFYAFRWRFFKDGWNLFDFAIISLSLLPSSGLFEIGRAHV